MMSDWGWFNKDGQDVSVRVMKKAVSVFSLTAPGTRGPVAHLVFGNRQERLLFLIHGKYNHRIGSSQPRVSISTSSTSFLRPGPPGPSAPTFVNGIGPWSFPGV
jgi:hypothetical protein